MPRTAKLTEIFPPLSEDPQHIQHRPASATLTKPQRTKSKSLQPCKCSHDGCGKMFSKRSNLKAHMRVHSGILPYRCQFPGCIKRFRWKSSLKPHIRVHTASDHVPSSIASSETVISTELLTNTNQIPIYPPSPQLQAAPVLNSVPMATLLDIHGNVLVFEGGKNSDGRPSTNIKEPDTPGMSGETEQPEDIRWRIECAQLYTPDKPPVAGVFFQDPHGQPNVTRPREVDLIADSLLKSFEISYATDDISFSFYSPVAERNSSTSDHHTTKHLWQSDVQVTDPFEELSVVDGESNIHILSGLDGDDRTRTSVSSMELHATDS